MSEHAPLMPSAAHQWVFCAGSVTLQAGIPDEDTDASMEGTAAHYICERLLSGFTIPANSVLISTDFIGRQAPNGIVMTEEMWDAASVYVDEILQVCTKVGGMSRLHVEERVAVPMVHEHCWGTPDCWLWDDKNGVLYVWDFKYGHLRVDAFENWQMICYILGILELVAPGMALQENGIRVVVSVVQPRCYDGQGSVSNWSTVASNLRPHMNTLHHSASQALSVNAQCVTGVQCRFCRAAHKCDALRSAAAGIIDHSGDAIPVDMTPVGLGYELEKLKAAELLIKVRKDALETDAEFRIRGGAAVPGWRLEQGYGREKFNEEAPVVIKMMTGVDIMEAPKPLPVGKAKTLLNKSGIDPKVIEPFYSKPLTSFKLKADDGSRARQIFKSGEL